MYLIRWGVDLARLHFAIVQRIDPLLPAIFESAGPTGLVLFLSLQREPAADRRGGHMARSISATDSMA